MRGRMRDADSYAGPRAVGELMEAGVVGEVTESNHDRWERGDTVLGNLQWAEYATAGGHALTPTSPRRRRTSESRGCPAGRRTSGC